MARRRKKRSHSRLRLWPALLGLVIAAGILAAAYYGITRLLAGVVPAGYLGIPGLLPVESDSTPLVRMTADSGTAYFGDLPADYAFRISGGGLKAADLPALVRMVDSFGLSIGISVSERQNGFDISPAGHDFSAGETYELSLSPPLQFAAVNLRPFQTVYFSIGRDPAEQIDYQRNVVRLKAEDVIAVDGTDLLVSSGSCKAGNILILPPAISGGPAGRAVLAESVTETVGGLRVTTREPALSEVFRGLDLQGRYAVQVSQVKMQTPQRAGLDVLNLSGGNTIKIRATVSPFGSDGPKLVLEYEDQPELIFDLRQDGTLAFGLVSSGSAVLDYELKPGAIDGISTAGMSRSEIVGRFQTALASEPDLLAENTELLQVSLTDSDSPLALDLDILFNLEAALQGSLSGQMMENVSSMAGARLFDGRALAYGLATPGNLTGQLQQLGSSRLSAAVTLRARMALLQYAEVTLSSRQDWQTESAGMIDPGEDPWGSLPGQEPGALSLGWYTAGSSSQVTASLVSRTEAVERRFEDLTCHAATAKPLGPWGTRQVPVALAASAPVEFDETMSAAALPPINLQVLDLTGNQILTTVADPADVLILFNRSQLFVDSGMLRLPAGLDLGEHTANLSLISLPDVRGSLTLHKNKPALSADLRLIAELLAMKKADAIARLGSGYTPVAAGADGWLQGFDYTALGLTLCFYPEGMAADPENGITADDLDRTVMVYCDAKTDFNGARVGMTPQEIQAILGPPTNFYPASEYFMLDVSSYEIQGLRISFAGSGEAVATDYAFVSLLKSTD